MTLDLLWQEYRACHPEGYQYSAFCLHDRVFAQTLPVTLRQSHALGERLFIDDSGQTVTVIDPTTGEARQAQIFVAVLGASNDTFVEATSPAWADWRDPCPVSLPFSCCWAWRLLAFLARMSLSLNC